jgi:hypothetical protein
MKNIRTEEINIATVHCFLFLFGCTGCLESLFSIIVHVYMKDDHNILFTARNTFSLFCVLFFDATFETELV